MTFFFSVGDGGGGGLEVLHKKNKLKSEIFHEKKVYTVSKSFSVTSNSNSKKSNWQIILTRNLVTFKRWVKNENFNIVGFD